MTAPWRTMESVALELEMAFILLSTTRPEDLPPEVADIPAPWWEDGAALAGAGQRWAWSLGRAARLAGVLDEADYRTATLAMRDLSVADAIRSMQEVVGTSLSPNLAPADELIELMVRWETGAYERYGLAQIHTERWEKTLRQELTAMTRILKGGDLHARFWFWVDQFYFQFYQSWRAGRQERMQRQAKAIQEHEESASLDWLAPQYAVHYYPGLHAAVDRGDLQLLFWVEPVGLYDWWFISPGMIILSMGQPDEGLATFRAGAEQVATRVKALADPTRLMILRLVRKFAMDNTQMAAYLGITRQSVSVHTQILRDAGLIQTVQRGRQASHTINPGEVERLYADLKYILDLEPETP